MLTALSNLALILCQRGQLAEAQQLQRQVLEARQRTLGEEHPDTLTALNNLTITLRQQGKVAEAEQLQLQVQVLEARKRAG